jgi:hypothetical protein
MGQNIIIIVKLEILQFGDKLIQHLFVCVIIGPVFQPE